MSLTAATKTFYRGATLRFKTTFLDYDEEVVQPASAVVRILSNGGVIAEVAMTPPTGDDVEWTAKWDSRGVQPGPLAWSIHTSGSEVAVEDGQFNLSANAANAVTFP